jgi:fermentation-respiration switch protein FrsA (DUF1100 family)
VSFAVAVALLVLAGLGALWWWQERIVFQPPRVVALDPRTAPLAYAAPDGHPLLGYLVGPPSPDAPLVLAFHGNADLAVWLLPWARELQARTGASVLLAEYRGYAGLPGSPSYHASALDARAALDFARDALGVPLPRIVIFGHSLGSAIAAELAAQFPPAALVLQSPFSSARDMSRRFVLPAIPGVWPLISRVHFDTVARVQQLPSPLFVAHGDRDRTVPTRMGPQVFFAARNPGELLIVPGAGHIDVPDIGGQSYWDWIGHALAPARA